MGGDMTGKAMVPIVAERLELGARAPGPAPRPDDRRRAPGDGEADQRPRLLPGPPDTRRGGRVGGRPEPGRRPVQGGHARQRRALDGARGRAAGRDRHPLHRLAGQRRHLRDGPDHLARPSTSSSARATRSRSTASRSSRPATPTRRPGTPSASCPSPSFASGSTGSSRSVPDPHRAIFNFHAPPYGSNLDNAPKLDADMNYVVGRPGARPGRLEGGPRVDPGVRSAAVAPRPHPRGQGRRAGSARRWRSTLAARTRTASSRRPSSTSTRRRER